LNPLIVLEGYLWGKPANTALVRTEQRLSVGVQGYLPPHNFAVMLQGESTMPIEIKVGHSNDEVVLAAEVFDNAIDPQTAIAFLTDQRYHAACQGELRKLL
jgi:hypothetical protein